MLLVYTNEISNIYFDGSQAEFTILKLLYLNSSDKPE